jgi:hypothetical protein
MIDDPKLRLDPAHQRSAQILVVDFTQNIDKKPSDNQLTGNRFRDSS